MKKNRRILQSILCCIIIASAVLFSIWFTTPMTDPVQIFRAAERRNLYKKSEIMGYEELSFAFDYAVLGQTKQGYLLYEWSGRPHPSYTGVLRYYPKQEEITAFSSAGFLSEHRSGHKSIPLFVIAKNYRATNAKVVFQGSANNPDQHYEQEVTQSDGGYFLFQIPCDELGCPSSFYFWEGNCTILLYDHNGNLLETHAYIPQL